MLFEQSYRDLTFGVSQNYKITIDIHCESRQINFFFPILHILYFDRSLILPDYEFYFTCNIMMKFKIYTLNPYFNFSIFVEGCLIYSFIIICLKYLHKTYFSIFFGYLDERNYNCLTNRHLNLSCKK